MKRMIVVLMAVILMIVAIMGLGCVTTGEVPTVFNQPCSIYEDVGATAENSLIAKMIPNPCAAQKILATAAKAPIVWADKAYVEMFEKWAGEIQAIIEEGISYQLLQEMVLIQIAKLNKEAGLALLIVSDGIFVFDGQGALIAPIDQKLLLMSLEDLRAQVKRMGILAGG